jgi:hypothetical protein
MSEYHDAETGEIIPPHMPPEIAAAIVAIKRDVSQLGFDERNEHARYNYASVDKFYTAVRPLESKAGLAVMLDETGFEIREGSPTKDRDGNEKRASWAFINYDVWLVSSGGSMWGPARRHWAGPVTGPQTFGAAESFVRKAFMRGLYMVPTGEKDGDENAPRDDAPTTKGVTRVASPRPTPLAARDPILPHTGSPSETVYRGISNPKWVAEFLARETYEIDPKKAGGWSAWEKAYCTIAEAADNFDQLMKLDDDNKNHCEEFRKAVKEVVYNRFRDVLGANARRLVPNDRFVDEPERAFEN